MNNTAIIKDYTVVGIVRGNGEAGISSTISYYNERLQQVLAESWHEEDLS